MKLGREPDSFINKLCSPCPLQKKYSIFLFKFHVVGGMLMLLFIPLFLFASLFFHVCLPMIQKHKQVEVVVDFVVGIVFPMQFADMN